MHRTTLLAAGIAVLVLGARSHADLKAARKAWSGWTPKERIAALEGLAAAPSRALLGQVGTWLGAEEDPGVRAKLVAVAARHADEKKLARRARRIVEQYVDGHLERRRRREEREFKRVCREHGTTLPPDDEIAAGRNWRDPWDEASRKLPEETRAERAHVLALVAALRAHGAEERVFGPALLRLFEEHHDPKVLVALIEAFGALKEWRALPAMADLWRPLELGRMVGGSHVIGEKEWRGMRLKWDVHKDRLWWSRPEYVLHAAAPIREAARAITGRDFESVAALDAWLLGNERELKRHGARLDAGFRRRAAASRR